MWGGELLVGDLAASSGSGTLRPVRLPGGERAIREPWRMACAWLGGRRRGGAAGAAARRCAGAVDRAAWEQVGRLAPAGRLRR